jgi:heme ABC exporter ATP-binding subunit CcmA
MIINPTTTAAETATSLPESGRRTVLQMTGITKHWGELAVLDRVDLALEPGQTVWVGGENGAGKTTLLRIISGLILPEAGQVRVCGLSPDRDRRQFHAHLGFLSAGDRGLYARLTVRQNLEFAASLALLPRARKQTAVDAAVQRFDLEALARRRVDRMSMGQRQRVRLALVFLHEPTVVLLDEPRTSLDESGIALLEAALKELTRRGGSAMWCSPAGDRPPVSVDSSYLLRAGRLTAC